MSRNIDELTIKNTYYRKVLYTGVNFQLILQSLITGEDVPEERHENASQFIKCVSGRGTVRITVSDFGRLEYENTLQPEIPIDIELKPNDFFIVEPNVKHRIISGSNNFKFYTIYNSVEHTAELIEKRQHNALSVNNEYLLIKNDNSKWSFYDKSLNRVCSHEFSNVRSLAHYSQSCEGKPCPECNIFK